MRRTIRVFLGEEQRLVGILRFDLQGARESASFEYDSTWLAHPDCFVLDPSLPLVSGPQFRPKTRNGSLFHLVIADTKPDGWARRVILRDHAKRRQEAKRSGVSTEAGPLCALDFLLAVDDLSQVGALRFQDEHGTFQRLLEDGRQTHRREARRGRAKVGSGNPLLSESCGDRIRNRCDHGQFR